MEDPDFAVATSTARVLPLVRAWRLDRSFSYAVPPELTERVQVGSLVRVPLGARNVRGIVMETGAGEAEGLEAIRSVIIDTPLAPAVMRDLLQWLATRYVAPTPAAFERVVPPRVRVKPRPPAPLDAGRAAQLLPTYTGGGALLDAISSGAGGTWCLRALPGSDSAVLIQDLIGAAGAATGAAVVLVPEVHYGAPVLDRLQEGFPDCIRLDSSRSEGERSAGWLAMAAGHGLGAGGRGSVLVPCRQLRLLVVDEEDHRSYKEDRAPRFDARRVAVERARRQGSMCVLISTAPLVETGASVRTGAFGLAEPTRAADRSARPIIEVIAKPADRQLAHDAHRRIQDHLHAGEKLAILAPGRGYARALWCGTCKRSLRCPVCEAGMRLDSGGAAIRCPRCGHTAPRPEVCPVCGARDFRLLGTGSERLAEQLRAMFPRARLTRVDPDTLEEAGTPEVGDSDIYLTTWVGTKPVLRPEVSLVLVLDADALIRMPDFRAAENAYRALVDMAEWAGPASSGGRLLVQTTEPSHHAIQALVRADYWFFLERELAFRRDPVYPPFTELVKVSAWGAAHPEVLREVADLCRDVGGNVLGPIQIRRSERGTALTGAELLIKHPDAQRVAESLRGILPKTPADTRLRVDVDPR